MSGIGRCDAGEENNGVADGTRTRDNRNHNPGLYQLSYSHRWTAARETQPPRGKSVLACPTGIEPITPSLEGWCSIRLSYGQGRLSFPILACWSGREDSNLRHPAPKAGTLPGCVTPRKRATITGWP